MRGAAGTDHTARGAAVLAVGVVSVLLATHGDPTLRPAALLGWAQPTQWSVPAAPRIGGTAADLMRQTQTGRRGRYAERGYGWHDPKLGLGEAVAKAVQPLVGEIDEMESEIEDEQHEIQGLQHHGAEHWSPPRYPAAQGATLRFSIPGSISIDHLRLPGGSYSLSLGSPAAVPDSRAAAAVQAPQLALQRPTSAASAGAIRKQALASTSKPQTKAAKSVQRREAKEDPLDALAESLSAPARRTELAMARVGHAWKQLASQRRARKHLALERSKHASFKDAQTRAHASVTSLAQPAARVKQAAGAKAGIRGQAAGSTRHVADAHERVTIFHHVHERGAPRAGGHAVAKIVSGIVRAETALTPAERAFAKSTMGRPHTDLHVAARKRLGASAGGQGQTAASAVQRQRLQHRINLLNVDKLQEVRCQRVAERHRGEALVDVRGVGGRS